MNNNAQIASTILENSNTIGNNIVMTNKRIRSNTGLSVDLEMIEQMELMEQMPQNKQTKKGNGQGTNGQGTNGQVDEGEYTEELTYTAFNKLYCDESQKGGLERMKQDRLKKLLFYYVDNYKYFKYYAKKFKFKINKTCNKTDTINNIKLWYLLNTSCEKIQKLFRGTIVRKLTILRGPGLLTRSICVNETDFCTLEPLDEIEYEDFFSYKDSTTGCIFGFDIRSLWTMYKKKGIILTNPSLKGLSIEKNTSYNNKILKDRLEKIKHNQFILTNGSIKDPYNRTQITNKSSIYTNAIELYFIMNLFRNNTIVPPQSTTTPFTEGGIREIEGIRGIRNTNEVNRITNYTIIEFPSGIQNINNLTIQDDLRQSIQIKLQEIRNKPINHRINEAFIEMGYLDFYTNANWFFNLTRHECYLFIQRLKHIWDFGFRNSYNRYDRILDDTKKRICFLQEPFSYINCSFSENEQTHAETQLLGIYIIEMLIYTGIDFDYKRLGAMYVLTALTTVSSDARSTLNWLYENFNSN